MSIRAATITDVPALAEVAVISFPDDPQWEYRFQYRSKYPKEHLAVIREVYRAAIEDEAETGTVVNIACDEQGTPMGLAVWDLLYLGKFGGGMKNFQPDPNRLDASPTRMAAFLTAFNAAHEKYFDSVHGNQQIRLRILCVHPDFRRRGVGELLFDWGLKLAKTEGVPITIVASPMGKKLYLRMGCEELGDYKIQADGEDVSVTETCMRLKSELWQRTSAK